VLRLNFAVKAKTFTEQELAERLGVAQYSDAKTFAEKMNLGNSVFDEESEESRDYIRLRIKDESAMQSKAFLVLPEMHTRHFQDRCKLVVKAQSKTAFLSQIFN